MTTIAELITEAGGVLHKRDLRLLGATDRQLTAAVRFGGVRRARRGWYTTFSVRDPRFVAIRVGGRLTGLSALVAAGEPWRWSRARPPITVSVPRNAARLRLRRRGIRVVYDPPAVQERGNLWSVHMADALARAVLEAPFEEAVALTRWAEASESFTPDQLAEVMDTLPADARGVHAWVDDGSESFPECIAATRLRLLGYSIETQAEVNQNQAIDVVIEDVVGLEIDGREFHESTFESDRKKDICITLEGRVALRASYVMVRDLWPRVEAAVAAAIRMHRRGGHASSTAKRRTALGHPLNPRGKRPWRLPSAPTSTNAAISHP